MKILTYTSLFPNCAQPFHGIFVYQRMRHFSRRSQNQVIVVCPVPWVPKGGPSAKYAVAGSVADKEQTGGMTVFYPKYLLAPKVSMPLHGFLMFLGSYRLVRSLQR